MKNLSVVIPVYNVEKYLSDCLESILNQVDVDLEVVLVDDGSTDGSGALCDQFACADVRVRVLHQKNSGVSASRNAGLRLCKGDYITFVDPDDWIAAPDAYSLLLAQLEQQQADAVFGGYWEIYEEPGLTPIVHEPAAQGAVNGVQALRQCLISMGKGYFTSVWNKIFRRSSIEGEGGILPAFDPRFSIGEDEIWLVNVLPTLNKVVLSPVPYYYWRQRTGSALHDRISITPKWHTALASKKEVIRCLESYPALKELSEAKLYNDVFHLIWYAYCSKDASSLQHFRKELQPYRRCFFSSDEFSGLKKIRYRVLDWMVRLHMPRRWVVWLGGQTSYRMKEKLRGKSK